MKIQSITLEEWKYTYSQSQQIAGMTGCIGHLRGDFGKDGLGFYSTWFARRSDLKTTKFKQDIDKVVNELRSDECGILKDLFSMKKYVKEYPDSGLHGNYCTEYGFRIMTEKYTYLLRCNINPGEYNFYCYCYITEWLDSRVIIELVSLLDSDDAERRKLAQEVEKEMEEAMRQNEKKDAA